jgi:hypothetical protein
MSVFEMLRESVSLEEITGAKTGEKARCVAVGHTDTNPSMHNYGDHVHCFPCGFHGDVVDVWAAARGLEPGFEAALDLAREYSLDLLEVNPEARQNARERGEKEDRYLKQARACHRALDRHSRVRERCEGCGFGEELQARFLLGANRDGTEAVVPFWHRGRIWGLVRRKLEGEPKYIYPKKEEFAGGHRPLFIPGPLRFDTLLVEGIVDALAAAALGESVVAAGGMKVSREQTLELRKIPGPLYVLPDDDEEEGAEASRRWVRDLCPPEYGSGLEDLADLFEMRGESAWEVLEELRSRAEDALDLALSEVPEGSNRVRYRYAKETVLSLLCRLDDEGERHIDESGEQTGRIVQSILKEASGSATSAAECERIREWWHDAIRLLEPAEVIIPYANRLEIPSCPIRIRRDARRLVDVVRVVAWLHQHQRERDEDGRILASEEPGRALGSG